MLRFSRSARERRGVCEALVAMSATGRFGSGPVCDEVLQVSQPPLDAGLARENCARASSPSTDDEPERIDIVRSCDVAFSPDVTTVYVSDTAATLHEGLTRDRDHDARGPLLVIIP